MQQTVFVLVLACIMAITFTALSRAQAPADTASKVREAKARSFVAARGVGKKVTVFLLDGTKVSGTISKIGNATFELVKDQGDEPLAFDYDTVDRIRKVGWSNLAMIAIGAGIGAAAVVTVVAIAVATVNIDPFPDGFRRKR